MDRSDLRRHLPSLPFVIALASIVVLTAVGIVFPMPIHTVADLGRLLSSLPSLTVPHVPVTLETLRIVIPYALAMAAVGLLELMLTASVVDDLTGTPSSKARECTGLGLANIAAGLFGGIAGCGMIGQTVSNVRYGGRGRLSTLVAGVFLLIVMVPLRPWVAQVPVAALVAIMIMVSISTFSWSSLRELVRHPKVSGVVMLATVAVTVTTHDLAAGVVVGVLLSGVFFAFKVTRLMDVAIGYDDPSNTRTYTVTGQIFFASADIFADRFELRESACRVRIDLTHAHLWDVTAVGALADVVHKFRTQGIAVETIGLNTASAVLVDRHAPLVRGSSPPDTVSGLKAGEAAVHALWPHIIGSIRGRYFLLTRQLLDAETAKDWGVVNEIVPVDRLLERAHEIADDIAALPPLPSRYTRFALTQGLRRIIEGHGGYWPGSGRHQCR